MPRNTVPEVFIIESLTLDDEAEGRHEGYIISNMLRLAGKKETKYFYLRTEKELENIIDVFDECKYRYLHISCHADENGIETTFDSMHYGRLGEMLSPCLDRRRVFVSACKMATRNFAREILPKTGCYSLIGPKNDIRFDDAAAFWVSFYHLMFKANDHGMMRSEIRKRIMQLSAIFQEPINYYTSHTKVSKGYSLLPCFSSSMSTKPTAMRAKSRPRNDR